MPLPRLASGGMPGRTVYLDQMAPDALDELEREAIKRLAELALDVAEAEAELAQIRRARAEL